MSAKKMLTKITTVMKVGRTAVRRLSQVVLKVARKIVSHPSQKAQ